MEFLDTDEISPAGGCYLFEWVAVSDSFSVRATMVADMLATSTCTSLVWIFSIEVQVGVIFSSLFTLV